MRFALHNWLLQLKQRCRWYLRAFKRRIPPSVFEKAVSLFTRGSMHPSAPYMPGLYPPGINLFGLFKSHNGLAQGARLYATAIKHAKIPHAFLRTALWFDVGLTETSMDHELSTDPVYDINVIHINPDAFLLAKAKMPPKAMDGRYNIGVWLWELDAIPDQWHAFFPLFDEIWAPSSFICKSLEPISPIPVTQMPYGIEAPVDPACTRSTFGFPSDDFLVLAMFDSHSYFSRKNPMAALAAFREAFPDHACVKLVLKMNNPSSEDLSRLRATIGDRGDVILITDNLPRKHVNALIACCDVFISLHRSEGFGLVMAEAMYLGVPVVATNYSANTDFMNHEVACMVDYTLAQADYLHAATGQCWADPDVHQAAAFLRMLYENPQICTRYAKLGQDHIRAHYSVDACGERIRKRVNEIHAVTAPPECAATAGLSCARTAE